MTTARLWPATTPSGGALGTGNLNLANEFEVSEDQGIYAVWFYSAPTAAALPSACAVWNLDTLEVLAEDLSPSWSGAAGSGWVSCTFDGTPVVSPGTHYAVSAYSDGTGGTWRYHTPSYWTTGDGASGITSGVLSAPSSAGSLNGQSCAASGSFTAPTSSGAGQNFWVDVEVGDPLVISPGAAAIRNDLANSAIPGDSLADRVLLAQQSVGPDDAHVNLLANGGFETGDTTGWFAAAGSTLEADDTYSHSGTYSGKITPGTAGVGEPFQVVPQVFAGRPYKLECWFFSPVPTAVTPAAEVIFGAGGGTGATPGVTLIPGEWVHCSGVFTPTVDTFAEPIFVFSGTDPIWMDDCGLSDMTMPGYAALSNRQAGQVDFQQAAGSVTLEQEVLS